MSRKVSSIEGVVIFDDHEAVRISISGESNSAWDASRDVLGDSVAVRAAILRGLNEDNLWEGENDDDDNN